MRFIRELAAVLLVGLPLAGLAQGASPAFGAAAPPRYRVVMQVGNAEPRGWHQALSNALALTKNAGRANVQIEIVANGMDNTTEPADTPNSASPSR